MKTLFAALALATCCLAAPAARATQSEVMHFWVSGSERAALDVIRAGFTARGGVWVDNPQKDDLELRKVLMQRLSSGTAPTGLQWHGSAELRDMAGMGLIADIDDIAAREGWEAILPKAVKTMVKSDGHFYLAPTSIHTQNWLFYNSRVLAQNGLTPPRNWVDLMAAIPKLEAAGVIPIALGKADWEERVILTSVLLGLLGREDFQALFDRWDVTPLDRPEALDAFRIFHDLMRHVGPDAARPQTWADATAAMGEGRAAFQFQGDWAKGELQRRGLVVGQDFGCVLAPGTTNAAAIVIDAFAFPISVGQENEAFRDLLATTIMDRDIQIGFSAIKGSVPARLDIPVGRVDACAQTVLDLMADPNAMVNPPEQALNTATLSDVAFLVHKMSQDPSLTPEANLAEFKQIFTLPPGQQEPATRQVTTPPSRGGRHDPSGQDEPDDAGDRDGKTRPARSLQCRLPDGTRSLERRRE